MLSSRTRASGHRYRYPDVDAVVRGGRGSTAVVGKGWRRPRSHGTRPTNHDGGPRQHAERDAVTTPVFSAPMNGHLVHIRRRMVAGRELVDGGHAVGGKVEAARAAVDGDDLKWPSGLAVAAPREAETPPPADHGGSPQGRAGLA